MLRFWITSLFLCAAFGASAQDCKSYYYMLSHSEVEMSILDGNGEPVGKQLIKVGDVKNEGGEMVSSFTSTLTMKNGKTMGQGQGTFKCGGSGISVDLKMMMPSGPMAGQQASLKGSDGFLVYPSRLSVGQTLQDASFTMDTETNGMKMTMKYKVTGRTVAGKEKVTTDAGSWECYRITYTGNFTMIMMGNEIPMNFTGTEWFAPGFGVVKSENTGKNGEKIGGMLITKLTK
ncbi:hypothetical protein ACFOTA_21905 [Chitinophaga sp. GCM10012297]|uniref:DUF3108 domain-containing protein n=1 Tax=Chitinophaga chungangae TaxID=2821488 RepID=A0ABS3YKC0_9BACT|nr:hypothetical protein [Chitinophaga chungangae]MBO9154885.1 hypothetical protein [Chitinophaga chungangae]